MTLHAFLSSVVVLHVLAIPALNAVSDIGSVGTVIGRDSIPSVLASITTDTGDFALGHRDFTRYDSPDACLEAGHTELGYEERTERARATEDFLRRTAPDRDTLPSGVVVLVRRCGARFLTLPVATAPNTTLPALFALALWAQEDTVAHAILTRQLATAESDTARERIIGDDVDSLLQARPARVALVEALAAEVDAQGTAGAFSQTVVHQRLLAFGSAFVDRARMRREAEALLRIDPPHGPYLPGQFNHVVWGRLRAYEALYLVLTLDHPDSLPALALQIQQDLRRQWWQEMQSTGLNSQYDKIAAVRAASLDSVLTVAAGQVDRSGIIRAKRQTSRLEAPYWMSPDGDTIQPAPGAVSLFVRPVSSCYDTPLWDPGWDEGCTAEMHTLARLAQQYRPMGLRITVVTWTQGHALYSGPVAPAEEARAIASYFQSFLGLRVTVAVQAPAVLQRLDPFPVVIWNAPNVITQYPELGRNVFYDSKAVLTDRNGRVRYVGSDTSAVLDALLTQLLPRTAAHAAIPNP